MTALLHCASSFSFLTGTLPLRRLCERAVEAGILHLGLCDWGGLYGIPQFAHEADRVGLHALHGVELGLDANRLFALARDEAGFRSLCRLVSGYRMSELEEREEEEADAGLLLSLLRRHQEGLWLFCDQAPFVERLAAVVDREGLRVALPPLLGFQRLRRDHGGNEEPRGARSRAAPLREELEPATRKVPDPPPPPERERLQQLAAGLGLGCVAAPWVVYGGPGERALHRLAVAVKKGRLVERVAEEELAWPGSFLPTQDELREGYADRPELLSEAERIAESCTLSLTEPRPLVFPSAMGLTGLSGEAAEERAAEALSARVGAGLIRLYGRPDGGRPGSARLAEARARLEHELRAIGELGFCGYFLIVDEIVSLARAHGIPCIGRGSAADSLVAYCLGFTDADPLHYKLCFERFLNSERFRCGEGDQLPDIDLDFCWRRRDEMLELVTRRFGEGHVALLCTQPALGFRAAYREAARAMGPPPWVIFSSRSLRPARGVGSAASSWRAGGRETSRCWPAC
ncbi:MAG: PHP domain-containing protein [Planctomycetota bacterium]